MTTHRKLNTTEQEAQRLNWSPKTLNKARSTGSPDIPYIKIGRSVRYDPVVVDVWLEKHSYNLAGGKA